MRALSQQGHGPGDKDVAGYKTKRSYESSSFLFCNTALLNLYGKPRITAHLPPCLRVLPHNRVREVHWIVASSCTGKFRIILRGLETILIHRVAKAAPCQIKQYCFMISSFLRLRAAIRCFHLLNRWFNRLVM